MLAWLDIPVIVNLLFSKYIQISMSRPGNINVVQWHRNVCTRGSVWWRKMKSPWIDQRSPRASASSVGSACWDSSDSPWISPLRSSFTPYRLFPPQSGCSEIAVSSWQFCCSICDWEDEFIIFLADQHFFCLDSSRVNIWCIQRFQIFQVSYQDISFANSPRDPFQMVVLSCQIDEFPTDLSVKTDDGQPLLQEVLLALSMVLQIVFHTAFSRLPGGLGHYADSNGIHRIWPPSPDCSNTADVPSFTRRTALSAMPFVSDRWGVDVPWFHDKTSHAFPNSIELSVYTTFGACDDSKNFLKKKFPSHVNIFFARIRLNPLSGLYHDCVSVIVSRFTSFVENLMICRYQVTKLFCSRWSFASASSARGFCYLGSQASVAIWVLREVSKNTVLPRLCCHSRRMFRIRVLRNVCWCTNFCGNQIICKILWPEWHIC